MKTNVKILLFFTSLVYSVGLSYGESFTVPNVIANNPPPIQGPNTFDATTLNAAAQAAAQGNSGEAAGIGAAFQAEGPGTSLSPNTNSQDRRNNAGQAGNTGGAGAAMATAAAAALTAAGTPMTQSIDPATRAAGYDLLSKAGLELGQAMADAGSQQQNNNQRDTLSKNASDPANELTQTSTPKPITSSILPDATQTQLKNAGVDPQKLLDQLANAPSAAAVAKMFGDNTPLSADQQNQANQLVNQALSTIPGADIPQALTLDESAKPTDTGATTASAGGTPGLSNSPGGTNPASGASPNFSSGGPARPSGAGAVASRPLFKGALEQQLNLPGMSEDAIRGVLAGLGGGLPTAEMRQAIAARLETIGVGLSRRDQNIFQKAKVHFTSFGRWRRKVVKPRGLATNV